MKNIPSTYIVTALSVFIIVAVVVIAAISMNYSSPHDPAVIPQSTSVSQTPQMPLPQVE